MSQKYPGGFITKSPVTPSGPYETSTAPGIWTLDQAMQFKKQGIWPTAGNMAPGTAFGGGFFAGQISTAGNGIADYNLVIGPKSSAQSSTTVQFKTSNTTTAGTSSVIDGPTNSSNMNNASHPAAQFCEAVNTGGFTDWYMPATNELEILYFNLKPGTASNLTTTGGNTNAVPSRGSFYTAGTPAQTAAAAFQTGGAEALNANGYWASTEASATNANGQYFSDGSQFNGAKTNTYRARAVRRVAV